MRRISAVSPCYPVSRPQTCISSKPPYHHPSNRQGLGWISCTISPHTTSCLKSPRLSLSVRNPSLPATSPLQSTAISFSIETASCVCPVYSPNIIHFPIRVLSSDSHRGLNEEVAGTLGFERVDRNRGVVGRKAGRRRWRFDAGRTDACRVQRRSIV